MMDLGVMEMNLVQDSFDLIMAGVKMKIL